MSLLGFDALGRWALGQLPRSSNFLLMATQGTISLSGGALIFGLSEAAATGAALAAGTSAGFRIAEPASSAPFTWVGSTTAFASKQLSVNGTFQVTGVSTNEAIRVLASRGATFGSGSSSQFSVSLASQPVSFAWAGDDSTPGRDHEAWVRRPFDTMSWNVEATLPPPSWSEAGAASGAWTADVGPANAWTPASINPESWTRE